MYLGSNRKVDYINFGDINSNISTKRNEEINSGEVRPDVHLLESKKSYEVVDTKVIGKFSWRTTNGKHVSP